MATSRKLRPAEATAKWLTIVGIGEDGLDGLGIAARRAIEEAAFVFGGDRHLSLAAASIHGQARAWKSPFDPTMADVLALKGHKVCVLASGDPFLHGVGATLARLLDPDAFDVYPAPSAFSLAASRLGWALQEIETISLHARRVALLRPLLHPGTRILALTSDGEGPAAVAALLCEHGFGASRIHVLEALGGKAERIEIVRADTLGDRKFGSLNLVGIEIVASADAAILPLGAALDDAQFEHDGQITKREIRAITLSALAPRRGALLWDIGAGAGSIAISWLLTHPSLHAIAIEEDEERAARIRRNADALGVPALEIVHGRAPAALEGLPTPDAIFIGGGGSDDGVMEAAIAALRSGGRLVANAVTTQTEAMLLALQAKLGGDLTRIALTRAAPIGGTVGWRPAMPVTQWVWSKP